MLSLRLARLLLATALASTSLPFSIMLPRTAFVPPAEAAGETFAVDTTVDTIDADTSDTLCADSDGNCSLRAAIMQANATAGAQTITVPAGIYTLTLSGQNENAAATGDLDITGDLTITGNGAVSTIIQAGPSASNGIDRVFDIFDGPAVEIGRVTIRHGTVSDSGGGISIAGGTLTVSNSTLSSNFSNYAGGGISSHGGTLTVTNSTLSTNIANFVAGAIYTTAGATLTVSGSTLSDNTTTGTFGGGAIYAEGGPLTVTNSTISGNTTPGGGGAIIGGQVTVVGSTISSNSANGAAGGIYSWLGPVTVNHSTLSRNSGGIAGGIFIGGSQFNGGTLTISNSTLSGNSATSGGGGIYSNYGTLAVSNSTLTGNSAGNSTGGGGIYNSGGTLTVSNSTISDNTANSSNGGGILNGGRLTVSNSTLSGNSATNGGGIFAYGVSSAKTITNTIVAGSTSGGDCSGAMTSGGHNVISDASCGFTATGDLQNTDPLLGPLADNGGPTMTHALLPGSPAINSGDNAVCAAAPISGVDQRGTARPQGTTCDIGAFELAAPTMLQFSTPSYSVTENGGGATITVARTAGNTGAVTVTAATVTGGTASVGNDFTATSTVLSWTDGDNSPKTLTIPLINDLLDEPDETVQLTLSNPTGGAMLGVVSAATLTITDDDVPQPPYPTAVLTDVPVGYWRLNESSGTVAQDLTTVNHGSYQNGVTLGTPHALPDEPAATGITLDGVNDFVSMPDSPSLSPTAAVSVETWVKLDAYSGSYPRLISKPGAYELTMYTYAGGEGRLEWKLTLAGGAIATTTAFAHRLPLGQWTHIAATYDGANLRVFINGVQRAIKPATGAIINSTTPLTIGMNAATRVPAAALDEVAVYGTALTAARVLAHYEVAVPPVADTPYVAAVKADAPAAYWRLNEASGTTSADRSGNQNTGVYTNAVTLNVPGALTSESDAAAQFDGSNDFIRVPDSSSLSPTAAVTVEAWVKLTSYSGSYPRLISKPGSYELTMYTYAGGEGRLEWKLALAGSDIAVTTAFADRLLVGQWYHVAAAYDGANLRIFINGAQKAIKPASGAVKDSAAVLTISRLDRPIAATLDEVAVYGSALAPARLQAHYTTR